MKIVAKLDAGNAHYQLTELRKVVARGTTSDLRDTILRGWGSSAFSTGALANSFKPSRPYGGTGKGIVFITSNLSYAGIQQTGGTIYPKTGKYLAMPLKSAKLIYPTIYESRVFNDKYLVKSATIKPKGYLEKALPEITTRVTNFYKTVLGNAF